MVIGHLMNNIKIRGFQKKVSDSDFGFQVGINEHFCFPNLFLLSSYINFTNFLARTGQNFARNLLVPSLEHYHCNQAYNEVLNTSHFY